MWNGLFPPEENSKTGKGIIIMVSEPSSSDSGLHQTQNKSPPSDSSYSDLHHQIKNNLLNNNERDRKLAGSTRGPHPGSNIWWPKNSRFSKPEDKIPFPLDHKISLFNNISINKGIFNIYFAKLMTLFNIIFLLFSFLTVKFSI